jgi:SAM-dependent methyltransferase
MAVDSASGPNTDGQKGVEDHYAGWFEEAEADFRGASMATLVGRLVAGPGRPEGQRVLDIGCGTGVVSAELLRRGCRVTSQDLSERMAAMCRQYLERNHLAGSVRQGGVEDIPETAAFDVVVALDVIEHIEDDRAALRTIRRAVTPNGRLVLSVPALSWLYGPKDAEIGHFRRYDREGLVRLVRECGFAVDRVRYWNLVGIPPVWLSVVRKKRLDESLRYSGRSPAKKALNRALRLWFERVENAVEMPLGLTLIVEGRPA